MTFASPTHWHSRVPWAVVLAATFACWTPVQAADAPKPDFTGVWGFHVEPGSRAAPGGPPGGFNMKPLPFTPEGKRRSEEYKKLQGPDVANPGAYCTDYGMPMLMESAGGYPIEFIQKGDQLTIIYEVEGELRRVYLGKRGVPKEKRLPSRDGYSVGHWEGATLVVETTDLTDGQDQIHPHSDQARIIERFSLEQDKAGTKIMSYVMTMTDPIYYTEPVTIEKKFSPTTDGYIMPYRCPDEFWTALLDARREQVKAGKPADARMSDVLKVYEAKQ